MPTIIKNAPAMITRMLSKTAVVVSLIIAQVLRNGAVHTLLVSVNIPVITEIPVVTAAPALTKNAVTDAIIPSHAACAIVGILVNQFTRSFQNVCAAAIAPVAQAVTAATALFHSPINHSPRPFHVATIQSHAACAAAEIWGQ